MSTGQGPIFYAQIVESLGSDDGREVASLETTRINPHGEFPGPLPIMQAVAAVAKADGYAQNDTDNVDMERQFPQLKGRFLIDRDGIVRWANIECATEGLADLGKFPSDEEILAAAQTLRR